MAESPKRPADVSRAEASRVVKPAKPAAPTNETARAADSVPMAVGPFTVLPTKFGRYRIDKLLGKGAMGAVYLAHDTQLDRSVALKVARVSAAGSAKLIQRMETEAKAAAKLDHPQICKVYDFGEIDGIRFIALQYIEGEDLKSYLKRVGRKREPVEAINLILQIAGALEAAHAKDVIHRDLKPENIMLNKKGEPVIMDFGLARRMSGANNAGLTQGMILGTAAYMSPEQAIGIAEGIDQRSDLYALGVMLFEMLTGEWPFTGTAIQVMGRKSVSDAPSPLSVNPNLPPQLAAVCHRMIAQKKEHRYANCAEFVAALEAIDLKAPVNVEASVAGSQSTVVLEEEPSFAFLQGDPVAPPSSRRVTSASKKNKSKKSPVGKSSASLLAPLINWWRDQPPAFRWTLLGSAGVCCSLLAVVLFFQKGNALVKVEVLADDVEVTFQKETLTLADGVHQFKVNPGETTLHIKSGNVEFDTDKFTLKRGDNPAVTVELVKSEIVTKLGEKEIGRRSLSTSVSGDSKGSRIVVTGRESDDSGENVVVPTQDGLFRAFMNRSGDWKVEGDELTQDSIRYYQDCQLGFGASTWTDYDFTCEAKIEHALFTEIGLVYRQTGTGASAVWLGGKANSYRAGIVERGIWTELKRTPGLLEAGRWYKLRVQVRGSHFQCFLDDAIILDFEDKRNPRGAVGIANSFGTASFRRIQVTDPSGKVLLQGLPKLPAISGEWLTTTAAPTPSELQCFKGHICPVTGVEFSRDGKQVLSCSDGETRGVQVSSHWPEGRQVTRWYSPASSIRLWQAATGKELDSVSVEGARGFVKLSPVSVDSEFTTLIRDHGEVRLWSISDGKIKFSVNLPIGQGNMWLYDLAFSPDGRRAWGLKNHTDAIVEWSVKNAIVERQIPGSAKDITSGAFAPNGRLALVAPRGQPKVEYDLETGKETGRWKQTVGVIRCMAFSPDSTRLVTGGEDGTVRLWDVTTATQLHLVGTQPRPVNAVAISPDGKRAVTGGEDQSVHLWDLDGKRELAEFTGHTGAVLSVAFSPNGLQAASGSADYTVRLWRLPPATSLVEKKASKEDPFQAKSVWVNEPLKPNMVLTVIERKDQTFKARWVVGDTEQEVNGSIKEGKVSWLAKDVRIIRGGLAGDNTGVLSRDKDGEKLDFAWKTNAGSGAFTLRLIQGVALSETKTNAVPVSPGIPADALRFQKKAFKIFTEQLTWHEAKKKCQAMGGRLAEVRSKEENDFITQMAIQRIVEGVWLGATDEVKEGRWLWSDGSELTYKNWSRIGNQPNNKGAGEHYLMMMIKTAPGEWCDQPAASVESVVAYICEWDETKKDLLAPSGKSETPNSTVKITNANDQDGFRPLFNGKDLTGWTGNTKLWKVAGNCVVGESTGIQNNQYLCTTEEFGDFELKLEFRLTGGLGNSGVQFRTKRGPAENDVAGYQADVGDKYWGSLYDESRRGVTLAQPPAVFESTLKKDDWNEYTIRAEGDHVVLKLNGVTTVDYHELEAKMARTGIVGLQIHHGPPMVIEFRNIRIKSLSVPKPVPQAAAGDWTPLFNGRNLLGWTPMVSTGKDGEIQTEASGGWIVRNGELVCDTNTPGWLRLDKTYEDAEFAFEFFLPTDTNSGLLIHHAGKGLVFGKGVCEVQLENDPMQQRPDQKCGALYGMVAPAKAAFKPDVWNEMSVRLDGGKITVILNGQQVADVKTADYEALRGLPKSGHFGLLNYRDAQHGHAKGCKFRNIRMKERSARP